MTGYYPKTEEDDGEPIGTSVQLPPQLHRDIQFIASLWNAFDLARGIKRRVSWKPATVIRRLLTVGRDGIAEELHGIPDSDEEREELISTLSAKIDPKPKPSK